MLNFARFEDGIDKCPTTGKYRKTLEKRKSLCTLLFCCYSSFVLVFVFRIIKKVSTFLFACTMTPRLTPRSARNLMSSLSRRHTWHRGSSKKARERTLFVRHRCG